MHFLSFSFTTYLLYLVLIHTCLSAKPLTDKSTDMAKILHKRLSNHITDRQMNSETPPILLSVKNETKSENLYN